MDTIAIAAPQPRFRPRQRYKRKGVEAERYKFGFPYVCTGPFTPAQAGETRPGVYWMVGMPGCFTTAPTYVHDDDIEPID